MNIPCTRPNLYQLLASTDLDELLDDYLKESYKNFAFTTDKENELYSQIAERKDELTALNFNLIKASLADSQGINPDDIKIIISSIDGEGNSYAGGNYLTINIGDKKLSGFLDNRSNNYNNNEISPKFFNLISNITSKMDTGCFNKEDIKEAIESYKDLKEWLGEDYDLSLKNGKLCLEKDGKYYDSNEKIINDEYSRE